ncbi:MAG: hypothetical protein H0V17_26870 [Deltaproteobacteria bacterium]|nr:hypothetical protein [Deltaproteobacteria bacterium]
MTALRVCVLLALASCGDHESTACDDGFCPPDTACGGAGVCLVEPRRCEGFAERTPCMVDDRARGTCAAATCVPGVTITGGVVAVPNTPLPDVTASVRGHPEVRTDLTNIKGFFDLLDVPRDSAVLVELRYPDCVPVLTRPIVTRDENVFVDVLYGGIPILSEAFFDLVSSQLGIGRTPGTAIIAGSTFDPMTGSALAGVTVAIEGVSCDGPFYFDRNGTPLLDTATDAESGVFGFGNCELGPASLVATRAGVTCRTLDTSPGAVTLELVADHLSFSGRIVCD